MRGTLEVFFFLAAYVSGFAGDCFLSVARGPRNLVLAWSCRGIFEGARRRLEGRWVGGYHTS